MTAPRVEAIVARTVIVNDLSANALVTASRAARW
jgi:hypothetical protein